MDMDLLLAEYFPNAPGRFGFLPHSCRGIPRQSWDGCGGSGQEGETELVLTDSLVFISKLVRY